MVRNGLFLFDDSKVSGGPMRTNLKETECPFRVDEWRKIAVSHQPSALSPPMWMILFLYPMINVHDRCVAPTGQL